MRTSKYKITAVLIATQLILMGAMPSLKKSLLKSYLNQKPYTNQNDNQSVLGDDDDMGLFNLNRNGVSKDENMRDMSQFHFPETEFPLQSSDIWLREPEIATYLDFQENKMKSLGTDNNQNKIKNSKQYNDLSLSTRQKMEEETLADIHISNLSNRRNQKTIKEDSMLIPDVRFPEVESILRESDRLLKFQEENINFFPDIEYPILYDTEKFNFPQLGFVQAAKDTKIKESFEEDTNKKRNNMAGGKGQTSSRNNRKVKSEDEIRQTEEDRKINSTNSTTTTDKVKNYTNTPEYFDSLITTTSTSNDKTSMTSGDSIDTNNASTKAPQCTMEYKTQEENPPTLVFKIIQCPEDVCKDGETVYECFVPGFGKNTTYTFDDIEIHVVYGTNKVNGCQKISSKCVCEQNSATQLAESSSSSYSYSLTTTPTPVSVSSETADYSTPAPTSLFDQSISSSTTTEIPLTSNSVLITTTTTTSTLIKVTEDTPSPESTLEPPSITDSANSPDYEEVPITATNSDDLSMTTSPMADPQLTSKTPTYSTEGSETSEIPEEMADNIKNKSESPQMTTPLDSDLLLNNDNDSKSSTDEPYLGPNETSNDSEDKATSLPANSEITTNTSKNNESLSSTTPLPTTESDSTPPSSAATSPNKTASTNDGDNNEKSQNFEPTVDPTSGKTSPKPTSTEDASPSESPLPTGPSAGESQKKNINIKIIQVPNDTTSVDYEIEEFDVPGMEDITYNFGNVIIQILRSKDIS